VTRLRLAWSSLRHYRRTHVAVALGVAAAVAVLAGAWLVGASVQASLASLTTRRLGRTGVVVGSPNLFPAALADRLSASLGGTGTPPVALLSLEGIARHEASGRRASRVSIYGIDARFGAFHGVALPAPGGADALVSPDLADELGADGDDVIAVRVARPTDIPIDSLHGDKEDPGQLIRLRLSGVLESDALGEFSLSPSQGPVRAMFVSLERLQRELDQIGLVNTILIAADEAAPGDRASAVRQALARSLGPEDLGLTFTPIAESGAVVVESKAGLIPDRMIAPITTAAEASGGSAPTAVLSWMATRMSIGDRAVPYSLVTALGPDAGGDATLAGLLSTSGLPSTPIVLNDWTARELGAATGDTLTLEYYRWADEGRLETARATFTVAGVVPMTGLAADRRLAPEYPGITNAKSFSDWTPPFPIDLRLVRPADEAYWDKFRATPKAFVPLDAGQQLWRTRYGQVTSLRIRAAGAIDLQALASGVARATAGAIDPLRAGFGVVDVRAQNLAASVGATDFGAYFSYFSFFLVVSAVLLAALFFRLSVEQRLAEIGLLRASGFSLQAIRTVFLIEASVVAAAGAAIGALVAIAWAGLMMYGLRTWWVGAVGTTNLTLHLDPAALAIGTVGGALAGLASIAITIRGLGKHSPRALIAGTALGAASAPAPRARVLAIVTLAAAALLSVAGLFALIPAAAAFFGAGALTLVGGLALFRVWLGRARGAVLGTSGRSGLIRLGLENASWRPGRSLTCAALVSSAVFLLVSVDAFRKGPDDASGPQSGTGGFALLGETALPFVQNPETPEGRDALLIPPSSDPEMAGVALYPARLRPGEDASCLNLYQPKQPRVVGVPPRFVDAGRFRFGATTATSDETRANPWRLLGPPDANGVVPAIVDATSLQYVLHAGVGDEIAIDVETDRPVRLRVVAALADSMMQGEIFVAEQAFLHLYPQIAGYRLLFVELTPPAADRLDAVSTLLEDRLEPYGLDVENSARRLEAYHRVENTYLSTFQTLGGLGLVLGSLGLMAVIARNVLERRREIALLGAQGYTGGDLQTVILAEHLALVAAGLVIGIGAAAVAILPVLIGRASGIPALPLFWIAAVAITGLAAATIATRGVRRLPLVPSLRSE
jgi:ABC-type antimicrobial peptide transport system permease subunit